MIKKYTQFINEDIKSKKITVGVAYINLAQLYPRIRLKCNDDLKIVISFNKKIELNNEFYEALKKDHINNDDIVFENCKEIKIFNIDGFTKVSDYGVFEENIKDFYCYNCKNLTSLDGVPKKVGGYFNCTGCNPDFIELAIEKYRSKVMS